MNDWFFDKPTIFDLFKEKTLEIKIFPKCILKDASDCLVLRCPICFISLGRSLQRGEEVLLSSSNNSPSLLSIYKRVALRSIGNFPDAYREVHFTWKWWVCVDLCSFGADFENGAIWQLWVGPAMRLQTKCHTLQVHQLSNSGSDKAKWMHANEGLKHITYCKYDTL